MDTSEKSCESQGIPCTPSSSTPAPFLLLRGDFWGPLPRALYHLSLVEGTLVGGKEGSLWEVTVLQNKFRPVVY